MKALERSSRSCRGCALLPGALWSAVVLALLLLTTAARASEAPAALQRSRIDDQRLYAPAMPPVVEDALEAPDADGDAEAPGASGPAIVVRRIEVPPSRLLDDADIEAALAVTPGTRMTLADLRARVDAVDALYAAAGHYAARAVLPAQNIEDGVVRVELLEARLGAVRLDGAASLRTDWLRGHIGAEDGELLDTRDLARELRLFNTMHSTRVRAQLEPGALPGTSDVRLAVAPAEGWRASVRLDNEGRDTVGRERATALWRNDSLTGRDDGLVLGLTWADGTDAAYVAYERPIGHAGVALAASLAHDTIRLSGGDLDGLDVEGEATEASLGLRVHRTAGEAGTAVWTFDVARSDSGTDVADVRVADVRVDAARVGVQFAQASGDGIWVLAPSLSAGRARSDRASGFMAIALDAVHQRQLGEHHALALTGRLQLTRERTLPAVEEFRIGGTGSVRGYEPSDLTGAEGYRLGAELRRGGWFTFLEHGGVLALARGDGAGRGRAFLTSSGLGWRGRLLSGALDVEVTGAVPLNLVDRLDRGPRLLVRFELRPDRLFGDR